MVSSGALGNNNLWSTLNINSYEIIVVWVSNSGQRSLSNGAEWNNSFDSAQFLLDLIVYWNFSILQELNKTSFGSISDRYVVSFVVHFNSSFAVVQD